MPLCITPPLSPPLPVCPSGGPHHCRADQRVLHTQLDQVQSPAVTEDRLLLQALDSIHLPKGKGGLHCELQQGLESTVERGT